MKNFIKLVLFFSIVLLCVLYKDNISRFIVEKFMYSEQNIATSNNYTINYDFEYINETNDYFAKNKNHLMEIIYTGLNNGNDNFSFFCDYEECKNDIVSIINSEEIQVLNNYVHPFNSFKEVNVETYAVGKITFNINKAYSDENIDKINFKIDQIIAEIIKDDMSDKEKIIAFHNYIIDNTEYDNEYVEQNLNDINHPSHYAFGLLFNNKALCGGYTDTMSLFLNKLKIPNYRISNEKHTWNFVKLDNNWYHLDLTWDDPTQTDKIDTFLLISTKELEELNIKYHVFNQNFYLEASLKY